MLKRQQMRSLKSCSPYKNSIGREGKIRAQVKRASGILQAVRSENLAAEHPTMDWRLIIMVGDTKVQRLSSAAKLTYLRSFLSCDALEVITCLSSSNADHEVAMERLREEFDRPAEVILQQISKLLHVLPKDSGLHAHYKYLRRIIDALTALLKNPQ
ncbi:hypothetical protein T10_12967 [Trichinella papuae]|uniref:Uncharacterized protein n=2 Tax=Trichinella papuae TaxID=268474 RepID=A0A0V1M272_9BILA|nr:hypothetical protein T10_12967 [Trichinella papuae]